MNNSLNLIVAAGSELTLPTYRCHKEVQACQILRVDQHEDGTNWIIPVSIHVQPFKVNAEYMSKSNPQPGGYYVCYGDGYQSFSPQKPFEDGYMLLPDPADPQPSTYCPLGTATSTWDELRMLENLRADCLRMAINTGHNGSAKGLLDSAKQFMDFIRPPLDPPPASDKSPSLPVAIDNAYRKKPVVISAFQLTAENRGEHSAWPDWAATAWMHGVIRPHPGDPESKHASPVIIKTLEGQMEAMVGCFIIQGLKGEIYPCDADIFAASYEVAGQPVPIEETGWVIEQGHPGAPEYFMFRRGVSAIGEAFGWSEPGEHSKALRFARQEDAAMIAPVFFACGITDVRVREHAWS